MQTVRLLLVLTTIVGSLVLSDSIAAEEDRSKKAADIILYSNDHAALVAQYWPRIRLGDVDAMVIAFEALNTCWHFKDAVSAADDLDEFESEMAGQHPMMQKVGRGVYFKCKQLVEQFDWYPGWEQLPLRAALAGDPGSRLLLVRDFHRYRLERPRESYPFSPAQFVLEALDDRDPELFLLIAITDAPYGLREQNGPVVSAAWRLVSCHYKGNCKSHESMERYCVFMAPECTQYKNAFELIEAESGGGENFAAAKEMADKLISAIERGLYEELGLILVN